MRRRLTRGAGVLVGAAMLLGTIGLTGAQEGASLTFPVTPDPAECLVTARPVDDFIPILTTTDAAPAAAETPDEAVIPLGHPAGAARAAAVAATVREVLACFNAGDPLRATALFTDDGVRRFFGPWAAERPWTEEEVRQLAAMTGPVSAEERQTLLAIANVSNLADGRVSAIVIVDDPLETSGQPQALFVYFARSAGRWLVDDFIELSKA